MKDEWVEEKKEKVGRREREKKLEVGIEEERSKRRSGI